MELVVSSRQLGPYDPELLMCNNCTTCSNRSKEETKTASCWRCTDSATINARIEDELSHLRDFTFLDFDIGALS